MLSISCRNVFELAISFDEPATSNRVFHAFQLGGETAGNAEQIGVRRRSASELCLPAVTTGRLPGELMERYREVTLVHKPDLVRYFGD